MSKPAKTFGYSINFPATRNTVAFSIVFHVSRANGLAITIVGLDFAEVWKSRRGTTGRHFRVAY